MRGKQQFLTQTFIGYLKSSFDTEFNNVFSIKIILHFQRLLSIPGACRKCYYSLHHTEGQIFKKKKTINAQTVIWQQKEYYRINKSLLNREIKIAISASHATSFPMNFLKKKHIFCLNFLISYSLNSGLLFQPTIEINLFLGTITCYKGKLSGLYSQSLTFCST